MIFIANEILDIACAYLVDDTGNGLADGKADYTTGSQDVVAFRLVCRRWADIGQHHLITNIRTLFTGPGLHRMAIFAKGASPALTSHVTSLEIGIARAPVLLGTVIHIIDREKLEWENKWEPILADTLVKFPRLEHLGVHLDQTPVQYPACTATSRYVRLYGQWTFMQNTTGKRDLGHQHFRLMMRMLAAAPPSTREQLNSLALHNLTWSLFAPNASPRPRRRSPASWIATSVRQRSWRWEGLYQALGYV
ncbi:hypothetical protein B0H63DRAFT_546538 [Podospora didyma]|uniref:F-box domain-containing protein n=1 Tax=Podospora didyma TaxID=330526 RepID=A0AAE0NHV5_9PEZI|nr:hypothetical protein B0H63DRAFT_546538 [Podospora didyma]